jgi:hypothetical protein
MPIPEDPCHQSRGVFFDTASPKDPVLLALHFAYPSLGTEYALLGYVPPLLYRKL